MLDNIKSIFFIKNVFSLLVEKRKLKLLKHNKILQSKLSINLTNYIFFTSKYIIYQTKQKAKEYNYCDDNCSDDKLVFEGEYLNGERNGRGKEYDVNGNLLFEGEYLKGERNGKGKEYYANGQLSFEGEYLKGKRWTGKRYGLSDNILYELKEGKGLVKENYGIYAYEGEYLKGEKNGRGKEYYYVKGPIRFDGEYYNDKRWTGKSYDKNGNIISEIKEGKGYYKEYYSENMIFECDYLNGVRNGKGKIYLNNKLVFEGEYVNGENNGKGKSYDLEGNLSFDGEYLYNRRHKGKVYHKGKLEFDGEYLFGKKWNGKGYDENGNVNYELINGKGTIKEYYDNGVLKFEGECLNGKRNGKGKEYNSKGELEFEGEYVNGVKIIKKNRNYYYLIVLAMSIVLCYILSKFRNN